MQKLSYEASNTYTEIIQFERVGNERGTESDLKCEKKKKFQLK